MTISTRFGILRVRSLLAGAVLALLSAGCGTAFWGEVPRPTEGAKPAAGAHSDAKAADGSAKGEKEESAHDKDKKEDAKAEAGDEKKDEKEDKKEEKKDEKGEEKIAGHVDVHCVTARRLPFAACVRAMRHAR